eukprot:648041-Prymnesium_polylepis.1
MLQPCASLACGVSTERKWKIPGKEMSYLPSRGNRETSGTDGLPAIAPAVQTDSADRQTASEAVRG